MNNTNFLFKQQVYQISIKHLKTYVLIGRIRNYQNILSLRSLHSIKNSTQR